MSQERLISTERDRSRTVNLWYRAISTLNVDSTGAGRQEATRGDKVNALATRWKKGGNDSCGASSCYTNHSGEKALNGFIGGVWSAVEA